MLPTVMTALCRSPRRMLELPPAVRTSMKFSTVGRLGGVDVPVVSSSSWGLSAVMTRK